MKKLLFIFLMLCLVTPVHSQRDPTESPTTTPIIPDCQSPLPSACPAQHYACWLATDVITRCEIGVGWTSHSAGSGGDNVAVNSSAVVDPDFVSTGDIAFTDTSNTITANINTSAVGADELNESGVEAGLEAVLDLQQLQGAVTDAQVPDDITIDLATESSTLVSLDADPADSGVVRLGNAESVCWEAATPGADLCVSIDGSDVLQAPTGPICIDTGGGCGSGGSSQEEIEDFVGGMVTGNTETLIAVTYQDADGTLDFEADDQTNTITADSGGATTGLALTLSGGDGVSTLRALDVVTVAADLGTSVENSELVDDTIDFDKVSDTPTMDSDLTITANELETTILYDSASDDAAVDVFSIDLSYDAATADDIQRGLVVQRLETTGAGVFESLVYLDNLDTTSVVTNGINISNNGGAAMTNGIKITTGAGGMGAAINADSPDITEVLQVDDGAVGTVSLNHAELAALDGTESITSGHCVQYDGTNFVSAGGACDSAPDGLDSYVQFNDTLDFGSNAQFVWDDTNTCLELGAAADCATPSAELDVDGKIQAGSLALDADETPNILLVDSTDGGEGRIAVADDPTVDAVMTFDVDIAGTLTTFLTLDGGETGDAAAVLPNDSIGLAEMAGGTDGNLITYDTSGDPAYVATGTAGQVLTSNGAGTVPTFEDNSGGSAFSALTGSTNSTAAMVVGSGASLRSSAGILGVPTGTANPGTCTTGDVFWDTNDDTDGELNICKSTNTWKVAGGGGGTGVTTVGDCTTGSSCFGDDTPSVGSALYAEGSLGVYLDRGTSGTNSFAIYQQNDADIFKVIEDIDGGQPHGHVWVNNTLEIAATDYYTDCTWISASSNGGIYYDASEDIFYKCDQNGTKSLLDTSGAHADTITWTGTSILETGAAFQFGDASDATLTHTYANTGTNVSVQYSTGAMDVTGTLTATNLSNTNTGDELAASETVAGVLETAIIAEVNTGTDDTRAVSPKSLAGSDLVTVTVAANTAKVTNATHGGDVAGATTLTIQANAVDDSMISTLVMSMDIPAGYISLATGAPVEEAVDGWGKRWTVTYTTGLASYFDVSMPDGWDGNSVTFTASAVDATSPAGNLILDIACKCIRDGDDIGAVAVGSDATATITLDGTAGDEEFATTSALTPGGTCTSGSNADRRLYCSATEDTSTGVLADIRLLGLKMEYTWNPDDAQ